MIASDDTTEERSSFFAFDENTIVTIVTCVPRRSVCIALIDVSVSACRWVNCPTAASGA
jgi:hypothetical protein